MSMDLTFSNGTNPGKLVMTDSDLNMTGSNAIGFVTVLGYLPSREDMEEGIALPPTPIGEFKAALERYLGSEIATYVDGGTPATVDAAPGMATMIHCGRRAGYFTDRAKAALQMTIEAMDKGATHAYVV